MEQQTGFKEMFLRVVAIVGLIAVLILGAWGIILLAFNLVGLFTGSVHLSNLFNGSDDQVATTTAPVVITEDNGSTASTGTSKPTTTTGSTGATTAVYTAAPRVSQLYGLADLAVTISSVTSLSSVQGRTVVQFTVTNAGTNVARSGWTFNAALPYQGSTYTYQSQAQQALYPGDSIAYTLTYDDTSRNYNGYNNQVCSQQYPYTCTYNNQNQYYNQYQQYPYNSGTCYTYNGYQNVPYPCDNGSQSGNPNYNYYNQYNQNSYNYGYNNYYGAVTITLDPQNFVPESAEYNNTATKGF